MSDAGNRLLAGIRGKKAPDVTRGDAPVAKTVKAPSRTLTAPAPTRPAPALHNGTATSAAAAESLGENTLAKLERRVLDVIRAAGANGRTCDEVEMETGLSHQTCSARFNGLAKKGEIGELLRPAPEEGLNHEVSVRRKTRSGRAAQVWIVKD